MNRKQLRQLKAASNELVYAASPSDVSEVVLRLLDEAWRLDAPARSSPLYTIVSNVYSSL